MQLNPALSAYLDFLRFVAALAVLLGHMKEDGLSMQWMPLASFSHEAVVVFFVLSGFIVFYSTVSRQSTWRQYATARFSRVYSVAFPAVVFSVLLAIVIPVIPGFDAGDYSNHLTPEMWHILSSLLFLNESWQNPATLTMNNPYWSLCYEVWYYAIFGAFFFLQGGMRWFMTIAMAAVAGPAIMLLFPVWIMGAFLAHSRLHERQWARSIAILLFFGTILFVVMLKVLEIDVAMKTFFSSHVPGFWRLERSQRFFTDYVIGVAVCLHIIAFASLAERFQSLFLRCRRILALLAGFSFTLYLFHWPMTQVWGALAPLQDGAVVESVGVAAVLLTVCWLISLGTERRLPQWRNFFAWLFQR